MDWEFFGVVATLTSATVVLSLTWAVVQRIMADTKKRTLSSAPPPPQVREQPEEILTTLRGLDKRLESLEDRLDFTERLLEGPKSGSRPAEHDAAGPG